MSIISLTISSFALAFGVFSATARTLTINGTISYVAQNSIVKIAATISNGYEDDNGDHNMSDIGSTRNVTVRNFNDSYVIQNGFSVVTGNAGRFLSGNRWNIGSMYFNPAPNVVPSNQTPGTGQSSATIMFTFAISNYSLWPIKIQVNPLTVPNALESIQTNTTIGYDLAPANIASIAASNVERSNVTTSNSVIYFKLNNVGTDLSYLNFSFEIVVSQV